MKQFILLLLAFIAYNATAQIGVLTNRYYISGSASVGQGDRNFADTSAWLQLGKDTTNKGLLLPRVFLDSIHTAKRGLFVYDIKDSVLYHFDGNRRVRYMTYKDTALINKIRLTSTDSLPEGVNNRYYTDARARAAISGGSGIDYDTTIGVINNTGVRTIDGANGDVLLDGQYIKQGGNTLGKNDTIGAKDNYGFNVLTNNATRLSIANTGKTTITGVTEDFVTMGNANTNKLIMGVGNGLSMAPNYPFIAFGTDIQNHPSISSNNFGNNRFEINKTDVFQITALVTANTPELRGAMNSTVTGSVIGIGSRANGGVGNHIGTSGTLNWITVPWHYSNNSNIAPTSGNMAVNILNIVPRVNQTGTANGRVCGVYINPVALTTIPDFRAIMMDNTMGYGMYQTGAAVKNYLNGNLGIKVLSPVEALEVGGNIKTAQPSASGAGAYKLGKVITGATVTLQTNKYVEVEIDGAIVKLAIVN